MLAQFMQQEDLMTEDETWRELKFRSRTGFLNALVKSTPPVLFPVIFPNTRGRFYKKTDVRKLVNESQKIYVGLNQRYPKKKIKGVSNAG